MTTPKLSLNDLKITLNGTFVRSKSDIVPRTTKAVIKAALENRQPNTPTLLSVDRQSVNSYLISARVYRSEREVYFSTSGQLTDQVWSYIVLIEIGKRELVIFRKSCAPISSVLERYFDLASYDELLNTFDDGKTLIQKIGTREMTVTDKGIRARSVEAVDLKGHMSPHAAGRSMPRFTQVRVGDEVLSLSLLSGRINQLSDRMSIADAAAWAKRSFTAMSGPRANKSFFSAFARRVSLDEVFKSGASPAALLFDVQAIQEQLDEQKIQLQFYRRKHGAYDTLKPKHVKRLLRYLERVFEVAASSKPAVYELRGANRAFLRRNQKSLTPYLALLIGIKIDTGSRYITLQSWINDHGHFIVSFDRPEYIYLRKACFRDSAGRSEVDSILNCLEPIQAFTAAASEKGAPTSASVDFDANSLFHLVEQHHAGDDYILCDDLGNEWADHITLNTSSACLTFIHSKHSSNPSTSASALHEVVGQAVKNLGNMHFTGAVFGTKKTAKFKAMYPNSQIPRLRVGDPAKLKSAVAQLVADHRIHRKCVIACTTLSAKQVKAEFAKLKTGSQAKGNVTQLFWILSSFVHACHGNACVPIVYCRP